MRTCSSSWRMQSRQQLRCNARSSRGSVSHFSYINMRDECMRSCVACRENADLQQQLEEAEPAAAALQRMQAEEASLCAELEELRALVAGQEATTAAEQELRARVRFMSGFLLSKEVFHKAKTQAFSQGCLVRLARRAACSGSQSGGHCCRKAGAAPKIYPMSGSDSLG